jgi:hypothetical protein
MASYCIKISIKQLLINLAHCLKALIFLVLLGKPGMLYPFCHKTGGMIGVQNSKHLVTGKLATKSSRYSVTKCNTCFLYG